MTRAPTPDMCSIMTQLSRPGWLLQCHPAINKWTLGPEHYQVNKGTVLAMIARGLVAPVDAGRLTWRLP